MADAPRPRGGPRRGRPRALHPRVASAPTALLRNEYVTRGVPAVSDDVLTEIIDEVFLPLVRGRDSERQAYPRHDADSPDSRET